MIPSPEDLCHIYWNEEFFLWAVHHIGLQPIPLLERDCARCRQLTPKGMKLNKPLYKYYL